MKPKSSWRSVRFDEQGLREDLRRRHAMRLHGWCIGLTVLGVMWVAAHLQMVMGLQSLAVRYLVTLGIGYLAYLAVLRLWAGWLVGRHDSAGADPGLGDLGDIAMEMPSVRLPQIRTGGGGDFGGGGASADFEVPDALADVASGALDVAGGADEGAIVVVPVVAVFLIGLAVLFGAGSLMLLYFGSEALLAVAVEVAFGYVTGRTAVRLAREGWMEGVLRLTWKPLLGALLCAVLLGATIDFFIPQARSLPHAIELIRQSP